MLPDGTAGDVRVAGSVHQISIRPQSPARGSGLQTGIKGWTVGPSCGGAIKVAVHRLRRKYQRLLREQIGHTVATDDTIDEEIQYLFRALKT